LALGSPLLGAYLLQRYLSGKSRPGWRERWGHLPETLRWQPDGRPRVWIHAVSAGEVVAAAPILRELRALLPEHELLLSVITPGGYEMATQQASKYVDALFYFPFDLPWVARRVVETIRPQVFVSLESELWPNVLHELKRQGAATVMVNGRLSEKSFRRAQRFGRGIFRWALGNVDRLLMQSEADAERVRALGNLAEPGRVAVLGNSKFDQEIKRLTPEETLALRRELRLPEEAPVFVAGSTRSPEEEAQVIAAYKAMQAQVPELCLLIAPRHIERAEEIAAAMRSAGLSPVRRTQLARPLEDLTPDPSPSQGEGSGPHPLPPYCQGRASTDCQGRRSTVRGSALRHPSALRSTLRERGNREAGSPPSLAGKGDGGLGQKQRGEQKPCSTLLPGPSPLQGEGGTEASTTSAHVGGQRAWLGGGSEPLRNRLLQRPTAAGFSLPGAGGLGEATVRHLILDTLGELANVYAVATFAFVGNSFEPVVKGGGQNLLQPLAHGKPVLFGPRTATIRSEVALAVGAGVGFQVAEGAALAAEGLRLLSDVAARQEIERRALALIAANQGVSARYAQAVAEMANESRRPLGNPSALGPKARLRRQQP